MAFKVTKFFLYMVVSIAGTLGAVYSGLAIGALGMLVFKQPALAVLSGAVTFIGVNSGLDASRRRLAVLLFDEAKKE